MYKIKSKRKELNVSMDNGNVLPRIFLLLLLLQFKRWLRKIISFIQTAVKLWKSHLYNEWHVIYSGVMFILMRLLRAHQTRLRDSYCLFLMDCALSRHNGSQPSPSHLTSGSEIPETGTTPLYRRGKHENEINKWERPFMKSKGIGI